MSKKFILMLRKKIILEKNFYEAKGFRKIKAFDDNFDGHILKTIQMCLTV